MRIQEAEQRESRKKIIDSVKDLLPEAAGKIYDLIMELIKGKPDNNKTYTETIEKCMESEKNQEYKSVYEELYKGPNLGEEAEESNYNNIKKAIDKAVGEVHVVSTDAREAIFEKILVEFLTRTTVYPYSSATILVKELLIIFKIEEEKERIEQSLQMIENSLKKQLIDKELSIEYVKAKSKILSLENAGNQIDVKDIDEKMMCVIKAVLYKNNPDQIDNLSMRYKGQPIIIFEGRGGTGKTTQMRHVWSRCSDLVSKELILYIPVKFLSKNKHEDRIKEYIIKHYTNKNVCNETWQEFVNLVREGEIDLILLIDGINEVDEKNFLYSELHTITTDVGGERLYVVISTRNLDIAKEDLKYYDFFWSEKRDDYFLKEYDDEKKKKILSENDIDPEDVDRNIFHIISTPMYMKMFVNVYKSEDVDIEKIRNGSDLIKAYVKNSMYGQFIAKEKLTKKYLFYTELIFPLISWYTFKDTILLPQSKKNDQIWGLNADKVRTLIKDNLKARMRFDVHLELYDLFDYIFYHVNFMDNTFTWTHDIYRDWFAAYGLILLQEYYIEYAIDELKAAVHCNDPSDIDNDRLRRYNTEDFYRFLYEMMSASLESSNNEFKKEYVKLMANMGDFYENCKKDAKEAYFFCSMTFQYFEKTEYKNLFSNKEKVTLLTDNAYSLLAVLNTNNVAEVLQNEKAEIQENEKMLIQQIKYAREKHMEALKILEESPCEDQRDVLLESKILNNIAATYSREWTALYKGKDSSPESSECRRKLNKYRKKAFDLRKNFYDQATEEEKRKARIAVYRSLTGLGTDQFHYGAFPKSIEKHKEALKYAGNYGQKVRSWSNILGGEYMLLKKMNPPIKSGDIFEDLKTTINLLKEGNRELSYEIKDSLLVKIKNLITLCHERDFLNEKENNMLKAGLVKIQKSNEKCGDEKIADSLEEYIGKEFQ